MAAAAEARTQRRGRRSRRPRPCRSRPARIARLKRFDTNWQSAVARIDAAKLTRGSEADLDALKSAIAGNLARLDAEALTMAQALAAAPFAPKLVQLVEARIRVEDMDAQRAAATLTDVTKEIARLTARHRRGSIGSRRRSARRRSTSCAAITTEWFNFYNGYDPLFTWWMGVPYAKVDEALKDYAGAAARQGRGREPPGSRDAGDERTDRRGGRN